MPTSKYRTITPKDNRLTKEWKKTLADAFNAVEPEDIIIYSMVEIRDRDNQNIYNVDGCLQLANFSTCKFSAIMIGEVDDDPIPCQ